VVLISHDRALLEAVGSRTIVVEEGKLTSHPSGWAEYQRRRDERESEGGAAAKGAAKKEKAAGETATKRRDGKAAEKAVRKAARLEQRIEKAEADLREVEEELADPGAWANPSRTERATAKHEAAKTAVEELLAEWEAAQGAAEAAAT
jgi:ATP-binding cassette subfamily F protein 3